MCPACLAATLAVVAGVTSTGGAATLLVGRRQLIVRHFRFDPRWEAGCASCSFSVDSVPHRSHLHARDTTSALVSRAPLPKLEAYRQRMGWPIPWYSSDGSDFNYDFGVTIDEERGADTYNFRNREEHEQAGTGYFRDGERVFHTCSTYGSGDELLGATYMHLDLTLLGRQGDWEQPPGRCDGPFMWWLRRHDEYESESA